MSLILDEHREYLSDRARIDAFARAVTLMVRPGDVVLDLGSGTGILGLMACRAGAERVYALEYGPIVGLARQIAQANGFGDRVHFIKELSTRAVLPEPVDLVLTDQIGRFGFEAGLLEYLPDARRRFLKPGGRTIPSGVDLWLAPVEHAAQWRRVSFWEDRPAGFDFAPARAIAGGTGYPLRLEPRDLLGAPGQLSALDLEADDPAPVAGTVESRITRAGVLHGIGGWFAAVLAPSVGLTNSPLDPARINRRNVFFPVDRPMSVDEGDRVEVTMRIRPRESIVVWDVRVTGRDGRSKGACRASTFEGMLMPVEDTRRTRPDFVPTLSAAGEARRTVLALCDGHRPLADIETEVFHRHADLLGTPERAAVFVAEVITRYAV